MKKEVTMNPRGRIVFFVNLMLIFSFASVSDAAYFVFHKLGNIRSGPGTKYRVIGQLSKETIAEVPATFHDFDASWIPIDSRTKYDHKSKTEKVVYTKWVHKSIGAVVKGGLDDVEKHLAIINSGWPKATRDSILRGEGKKGMTTHMVYYAWGRPDEVKEATGDDGPGEQWVYKRIGSATKYLFFKDSVLTAIQE